MKERWYGVVSHCFVVNVRSSPAHIEDNIIGFCMYGTALPILEKVEEFYKVSIEGSFGYIDQYYLEETHRKIKNIKRKRNSPIKTNFRVMIKEEQNGNN